MAGIFYRNTGGGLETLTKTEYTAVTPQTKTLYIKSGNGSPVRYGLTSDVSASNYSPKIPTSTATYYIARASTYETTSETTTTYTEEDTYTQTATDEQQQATTRASWYYNNAVIQTTSSTSSVASNTQYTGNPIHYIYEFTSKVIGGGLVYRTLTLTSTRYYSNGSYYYFSTTDKTTTHSAINGLTYRYSANTSPDNYNPLNPPSENYWYNNPTNNLNYSYAAGYTVSGGKSSITYTYLSLKISASMLYDNDYDKPVGITGTYRYGGGYSHKSSTSRTLYSRSYSGTTIKYIAASSNSNGATGMYIVDRYASIDSSLFTKMSNRAASIGYSSKTDYTITTASKTYYSRTLSASNVKGTNHTTTAVSGWESMLFMTTFTATRSSIGNSLKSTTPNWAKSDRYLPANTASYCHYVWTNSISRSSYSYGYGGVQYTRSASAYVTTARTYTSRSSDYTQTITVTVTNTITDTITVTQGDVFYITLTSSNCNV